MLKSILIGILSLAAVTACMPEVSETGSRNKTGLKETGENLVLDEKQIKVRENLLSALEKYEKADVKSGYKGYYAQSLSMAGRSDIPFKDKIIREPKNKCKIGGEQLSGDPIETILRSIGKHTLIIVNEDHKMPRDRVLIRDLLKALKTEGFTHYAAETFQENISDNSSEFGVVGDGYYSNEPIFGRLISYAKKAGFQLVPYEITHDQMAPEGASISERIDTRENAQSNNLITSVLGDKPNTKMIVHVGHSHVAEIPIKRSGDEVGTKWMAARLKDKTGIDPLTISQTACGVSGTSSLISTEVYDKDNAKVISYTDFAIGHPPLSYSGNRPDWRRQIGDIEFKVPSSLIAFSEPVIIEARKESQPDSAVPVDRLLLREGENDISLLLPPGRYRIEAFNKTGRLGKVEYVTVTAP